ncbi:MAG: acylphosphatase [Bacteroidales bacterium]|nr:acylphosphatase [Bacteroidales bacterium]MBN2820158.1 acylphosphatase [Bacteroidales bacterium]
MEIHHYTISISGRVQGVGFRYTAQRMARGYGLKGFVMNRYDGSVYIEAEGSLNQLTKFVDWCKIGPPHSRVDTITFNIESLKNYTGFDIR